MISDEIVMRGARAMIISQIFIVKKHRPAALFDSDNGKHTPSRLMYKPHAPSGEIKPSRLKFSLNFSICE